MITTVYPNQYGAIWILKHLKRLGWEEGNGVQIDIVKLEAQVEIFEVRDIEYEEAKREIAEYISKSQHEVSISEIAANLRIDIDTVIGIVLSKKEVD